MDTSAYIESGILEAYTLGALTNEEAQQVEADIAVHPELATELRMIEDAMLAFATVLAKELPPGLDNKIWGAIQAAPATGANGGGTKTNRAKVIPLHPEHRKAVQWRYAAIWIALVGSLLVNVLLWQQGNKGKAERDAMSYDMAQLKAQQAEFASLLGDYHKNKTMMADTGMQTIVMHTMQPGHPMAATLYWSKAKGEAYVSVDGLPEPPKGMQYQLWVIRDGKPVDMGTLPNSLANTPAMQKVGRPVTGGQAFAISLEKEGGSPTPTMQNIYVMGKV